MFVGQTILPDHVSETRQTLRPVAVFGFWVSGQVVWPSTVMILT